MYESPDWPVGPQRPDYLDGLALTGPIQRHGSLQAVPLPHTDAMQLSLRSVRSEDEDFLFRLYASTRQEEMSTWGWDAAQQDAFLRLQFRAQRQGYAGDYPQADHRVILVDDQPVGRLIVHRTEKEITLVDIAVLSAYRSRGMGRAVILDLIEECEAAGNPLRLQVAKGNRAVHLYERLGFCKNGEDELYYRMCWEPTPPCPTKGKQPR